MTWQSVAVGTIFLAVAAGVTFADEPVQTDTAPDAELIRELGRSLGSKNHAERTAALESLQKLVATGKNDAPDYGPLIKPLFNLAGWGGLARENASAAEDLIVRIGGPPRPLLLLRLKSEE